MTTGRIVLWCRCQNCNHEARIEEHRARGLLVERLRVALVCRRCGARRAEVRQVWVQGAPPRNVTDIRRPRK
jgi:hypothetical protein